VKRFCTSVGVLLSAVLFVGCASESPGTWKQPKVEAEISQRLKLRSISITPAAGGYTGTGPAEDGETYKLKITQDAAKGRLEYVAEGDRGSHEDGFISLNQKLPEQSN
jgi:hypothetical protein